MTTCKGTTSDDEACDLPAGWGLDEPSDYCRYHVDQQDTPAFSVPTFETVEAMAAEGSDLGRVDGALYARVEADVIAPVASTDDLGGDTGETPPDETDESDGDETDTDTDTGTGSGDETPGVGHVDKPMQGDVYRTSEYGPQGAIDAASPGDTALFDAVHGDSEGIRPKSGVNLVAESRHDHGIVAESGNGGIRLENVSDVVIDGLLVDNNVRAGFLVGGNDCGTLDNITVQHCLVQNSYFNGIGIASKSGDITNVTVRHCTVKTNRSHGIILGVNGGDYRLNDCAIVHNYGEKTGRALMFTMFAGTAEGRAKGRNNRINYNVGRHAGGWLIAYEDRIFDSEIVGNDVRYGGEFQSPGGIACTKEASRNYVADNRVRDVASALAAKGHPKHPEYGAPNGNVFENNAAANIKQGIDILGSGTGNRFEQNTFRNWDRKVRDPDSRAGVQTIRDNSW